MDVPKHVLDTPKNRGVVFVMLLFEGASVFLGPNPLGPLDLDQSN